jgi:CelD/BcsL family acetyltransferase involved in cellulose biosynthesis
VWKNGWPSQRSRQPATGDRPISYLFCSAQAEVLLYRHFGYDPEFGRWSPGTVPQYLALERLFAEGRFRLFDFTAGAHKQFFSTGSTRCADLYFFRRTPRNLLLLGLHAGAVVCSDYDFCAAAPNHRPANLPPHARRD